MSVAAAKIARKLGEISRSAGTARQAIPPFGAAANVSAGD
jgi:hypothetical protein